MTHHKGSAATGSAAPEGYSDDLAVAAILDTLDANIHTARGFPIELMHRMQALTSGIKVDLDAPIEGDVNI